MNKLLIGVVGALAIGLGAAPATAADLAPRPYTKAPPMIAAIYDWSGFYVGANGGWGSSRSCWDLTAPVAGGCHDATGGTIGGQIGYRWQSNNLVFGLEAQGNWADLNGRNVSIDFSRFTNHSRLDAFGLFTGQIGYSWDATLLYVKGGAAVTSNRYRSVDNVSGLQAADSVNDTRWGGVVGVGLEYGFAPNWSLGFEYDHIFMGNSSHTFINNGVIGAPGTTFGTDNIRQDVDLVTARINYRWGGPAIARY
ncbi:putative outer-membrane protein precursor [Nitrobacter hamburgensis X14]|uniref:Putative outer-membrane protein n=1 Tax=Nitrobacter hamburgensis (strain DSM 10229 / NCIMB 13809 / X14) TaxID=323097 RepID=Q1QLM0_NITHX|nr:outer membrane beta-barrel protein [Nitrobacter hamburgensis]ABE62877.1 putative outer-membrane protein precursor [Nitrobacter hamburgensis X14]